MALLLRPESQALTTFLADILLLALRHAHLQDGGTALKVACREGHFEVVKLLLGAGADTKAANQAGCRGA